ncbi:hypothetical protein CYMTET_5500 [Cymbomonas tetramitiformis]|uniref:Uncharacterized protein n=1 Tax=Cymbomonas tetramitiformis TaxID=36881 RepID=A0AAE0H0Y8_9CHLO|nr:hypothetical protein CYMTET_5500 [Cymbomonas tetramitiformis]
MDLARGVVDLQDGSSLEDAHDSAGNDSDEEDTTFSIDDFGITDASQGNLCEHAHVALATPEVEDPGAAKADDTANVIARRKYFSDQTDIVKPVRESGLHRKWTKNLRETVLGGKHEKFAGKDKDVAKLGKLIVILNTEFWTAGLDLASFEFDNPALEVIPLVNELVYDTFSEVVESDSVAEQYFLATDCSRTDRDGRRALIDLVKGVKMLAQLVRHHRLRTNWANAQQGEVVGTAAAAAIPAGDDSGAKQLLKVVVDKLRVLEHLIKNQKGSTPALKAATAARKGLNGYRPGLEKGSG